MRKTADFCRVAYSGRTLVGMSGMDEVSLNTAKLKALAEFAAGAGHEINNPVATIVGRVQLLLRDEHDPQRRQALQVIGGQAYRIRDMIGDLMLFARPPQPDPCLCALSDAVRQVLEKLQEPIGAAKVTLDVDLEDSATVWADATQLAIVISGLLHNSLEAVSSGHCVRIATRATCEQVEGSAVLTVADDGPGLDAVEREHLFDPFFSGRQAGRGLGFGLPKCWRIITNHGGRIEVRSNQAEGTAFDVYWPSQEGDVPADQ